MLLLQQRAHQGLELVDALAHADSGLSLRTQRVGAVERDSLANAGLARKLTIASYSMDAGSVSAGFPTDGEGAMRAARDKRKMMGDLLATPTEAT